MTVELTGHYQADNTVPAATVRFGSFWAFPVALLIAAILYFILAKVGTWPGITQPRSTLPALGLLGGLTAVWLIVRLRRGAPPALTRTPLDRALPVWLAAFAVSTAANLPMFRYMSIGLWFAGLYIAAWYTLHDALQRRLLAPLRLLDGLLFASVPVSASALIEYVRRRPLRVSGVLENPNILGAFLVLVIPIAFARLIALFDGSAAAPGHRNFTQVTLRIGAGLFYIGVMLGAIGALILSDSRGGILGACSAFGFVLFRRSTTIPQKGVVILAGLVLAAALFGIRGDSGRMDIYQRTLNLLSTEFLTGQGLFTFRRTDPGAIRSLRLPPDGQNLHAHNIGLQIAIELGVLGVAALTLTLYDFVGSLRSLRSLNLLPQGGLRPAQEWAFAAAFGLLIQQIADFTVMTPSIALCLVLVLNVAVLDTSPNNRRAAQPQRDRQLLRIQVALFLLLIVLIAALIVTGALARAVPRALL